MYVCVSPMYLIPSKVRRGRQIPGTEATDVVSRHGAAGSQTWVLVREQSSLNHWAIPQLPPLETEFLTEPGVNQWPKLADQATLRMVSQTWLPLPPLVLGVLTPTTPTLRIVRQTFNWQEPPHTHTHTVFGMNSHRFLKTYLWQVTGGLGQIYSVCLACRLQSPQFPPQHEKKIFKKIKNE